MTKLTLAALAIAGVLMSAPTFAQAQGSEEAADYALSWGAVHGGYGGYGNAYAGAGYTHSSHRRHSH